MNELAIHQAYKWLWRILFIVTGLWVITSFCG